MIKVFLHVLFVSSLLFGNSADSVDDTTEKEKEVKVVTSEIDVVRSKIVILQKHQIKETYGVVFEQSVLDMNKINRK